MLLEELRFRDCPDDLVKRLGDALPPDDQERVLVHVSAQGAIKGHMQTKTFVAQYDPLVIGGRLRPAILWTTASSIAAVVDMVSRGKLPQKGLVKQEDIPLPEFLKTTHGKFFAQYCPKLESL